MFSRILLLSVVFFQYVHGARDQCARYKEPCGEDDQGTCCGYPLFDCITDGAVRSCQPMSDYPELYAEVILRVREAIDRGANQVTLQQLQDNIDSLLQNRPNTRPSSSSRGRTQTTRPTVRRRTTSRTAGQRSTTRRRPSNRSSGGN